MAIKDIDDLTRPLSDLVGEQGERAARRKKQLAEVRATRAAGMTADEAKAAAERGDFGEVGQELEGTDFLSKRLVKPTDFDQEYYSPVDRIDVVGEKRPATIIDKAFKMGFNLLDPRKKVKFIKNMVLGTPTEFSKNLMLKSDDILPKTERMQQILKDIGQDKLSEIESQPALINYIKENFDFVADQGLVSKALKKGNFKLKPKPEVDEKFIELFESKPRAVDSLGKIKANNALSELIKLEKDVVLKQTGPELIDFLKTKNITVNKDQAGRLRELYKKFMDVSPDFKFGKVVIDTNDIRVDSILEDVLTGKLKQYEGALELEKIFPKSGILDRTKSRVEQYGVPSVTGKFTEIFNTYKKQLTDPDLIKVREGLKTGPSFYFDRVNIGEIIPPNATTVLRQSVVFDKSGKTFNQTKRAFLKDDAAVNFLNQTKNLFQDKTLKLVDIDHVQAPRFGGTNATDNLRLITRADHLTLKAVPTSKSVATDVVKAKSGFEDQYFNLSKRLVDNVKNNNFEAADKIAESLKVLADNFKKTYKNTDFIVNEAHVPIKTGKKTAEYVKYSDYVKLSNKQKKYIKDNNLLPEQSNLPNQGKSVEKQAEDIYNGYLQIYNLIGEIPSQPIGKVAGEITSMDVPRPIEPRVQFDLARFKNGGIASMEYMIRPLDGQR
jgi:hypothetical protein